MGTTVSSKGRITIPKHIRDVMGIGPGSVVEFARAEDGRIVMVKGGEKGSPDRFSRLRGHAGKGLSTEEIMALTRSED